ncbi:MAG TPA: DUF305 domain-containing protein [Gemmatimonadaceae bacterium]|nr:DUF305 domain-containing protein [Gemmatimonadaceae bacterium]
MTPSSTRPRIAALVIAIAAAACRSASGPAPAASPAPAPSAAAEQSERAAIEKARADSARYPYTAADVHFMQSMIGHHAQAIHMANWAPGHGASRSVQILAERIINGQGDEIRTMQQWLRDRRQQVPDAHTMGMKMSMGGVEHVMLMPGMLTDAQLAELDATRGPQFDRLFLTYMIQHHRGAVSMVKELFGTQGAGQDETVFKFASDVNVDQSTEIARMEKMLAAMPPA